MLREALQAVLDADDAGLGTDMDAKFAAAFQRAARLCQAELAALATPSPQAPQGQSSAFSTTSAREQSSETAAGNLDTATVAWAIEKICRHCRAGYPDRQTKGYIANWGSVSDGDWMHAPTPQFEWRYCHASILHEALRNEIRVPAATQEQPAGSVTECFGEMILNSEPGSPRKVGEDGAGLIRRCMARNSETGQCELREGHAGKHLGGYLMWGSSSVPVGEQKQEEGV